MKQNFKFLSILTILLVIYIFISAYSYVSKISNGLSNNVFRLHVIANSDSIEDQNLKYIVRDNLIAYMDKLCINCSTKQEVIDIANENVENFKTIAEQTIRENGFSYPVNIEIGNYEFPTKTYGDISFPTGSYDALKVEIGKATGQNWWCVMFPPLCFISPSAGIVSNESKQTLQNNLSNEEYQIISATDSQVITFKFKIIEFFQKSGLITAKNN